jgi:MFS family permease
MSSFATYLIGFIILVVGLAAAAFLLNVPTSWIIVGVIVLLGIGVLMATSRTKTRDVSPQTPPPPPRSGYDNRGPGAGPTG